MNRQQSPEATDIETERATLPWTQYVSRFEVMPPGAIPHLSSRSSARQCDARAVSVCQWAVGAVGRWRCEPPGHM